MTDYLTLTEFVPGTKAKAQEVNANFSAVKDALNAKALMNGDGTQLFSVAAGTSDAHAVNKSQLTQLSDTLSAEVNKIGTKFCVRSGNVTAGKGDLFSSSGLLITPKIGGAYASLVIADYKGVRSTISASANLSMTGKPNGTYNIFVTPSGTLYALANTVYKQAARPTLVDGDVWLNTSAVPFSCVKYVNSADVEFLDLPLGKVVITAGAISSLETFPFNQNGFEVNVATFTQNLVTNGWTKLPNGFIIQWGTIASGVPADSSLTFPVAFPNSVLHAFTTSYALGGFLTNITALSNTGLSYGRRNTTPAASTHETRWIVIGY